MFQPIKDPLIKTRLVLVHNEDRVVLSPKDAQSDVMSNSLIAGLVHLSGIYVKKNNSVSMSIDQFCIGKEKIKKLLLDNQKEYKLESRNRSRSRKTRANVRLPDRIGFKKIFIGFLAAIAIIAAFSFGYFSDIESSMILDIGIQTAFTIICICFALFIFVKFEKHFSTKSRQQKSSYFEGEAKARSTASNTRSSTNRNNRFNRESWHSSSTEEYNREKGLAGERKVNAILSDIKKRNPRLVQARWSTPNMIYDGKNFEVDALLYSPSAGFILIEVKNYGGTIYCSEDKFEQVNKRGEKYELQKNPSKQVQRTRYFLSKMFRELLNIYEPIEIFVVFADVNAKIFQSKTRPTVAKVITAPSIELELNRTSNSRNSKYLEKNHFDNITSIFNKSKRKYQH